MLFLASKSPRRRELLARLGVAFEVIDIDVPEQRIAGEDAPEYVLRVARDKARAGFAQGSNARALVLGSDTEVVLDDEVFGKPRDADDAAAMLGRLSGRTHQVISAVVLVHAQGEAHAVSYSDVAFAPLTREQIARYVESGEYEGKAGAYGIQGQAEALVERLGGSYSGVMGLPLYETGRLLAGFGLGPYADAGGLAR